MQQELNRQRWQSAPDNKVIDRVRSPVDLNKLSLDNQSPTPMKSKKNKILKHNLSAEESFSCLSDKCNSPYKNNKNFFPNAKPNCQKNISTLVEGKIERANVEKLNVKMNNIGNSKHCSDKKKPLNRNREDNFRLKDSKNNKLNMTKKKNLLNETNSEHSNVTKKAFSFIKVKSKRKYELENSNRKFEIEKFSQKVKI